MNLSTTDENAIRFLVGLTGFFSVFTLFWATFHGMSGSIVVLPLSFGAGSIAVFVAPSFYEMTMKDSYAVLKTSLLIALVISLVAIFSLSLGAAIVALVFVFSPVLYDFIRDLVFPNVPQEIPWHERKVGVRLLEIVVEAVISSLIGLVVILAVTGHL